MKNRFQAYSWEYWTNLKKKAEFLNREARLMARIIKLEQNAKNFNARIMELEQLTKENKEWFAKLKQRMVFKKNPKFQCIQTTNKKLIIEYHHPFLNRLECDVFFH